ncbi:divergent PAP2 family protein [Psychrobacter aquimaris]|uniref:divergent PAP2 family protein n=1 Tax=Psychrobacter aquimaris TaxID=292733 RepID=UPI0039C5D986
MIGFDVGIDSPSFSVAATLAFIVILDASILRKQIEKQAICINHINENLRNDQPILRQRIGHTKIEIFFGIFIGGIVGFFVSFI